MNLAPRTPPWWRCDAQVLMTTPTLTFRSLFRSPCRTAPRAARRSLLAFVPLAAFAILTAGAHPAAAAARTWSGAGGNNQWTTPANWQGGVAPVAGDELTFPAGGAQTTNVNNFPAGTSFAALTFAAAYTVSGNALTLTGPLAITAVATVTVTLGTPVAIASAPDLTVNVQGTSTLELGGVISGGAGLT